MTKLSANLNKIALLRNSRGGLRPDVIAAARTCLEAGADGITMHPRPDQRHAKPEDIFALRDLLSGHDDVELNVEGNPLREFMELVAKARPEQCTLVPDDPGQLTSDHGWTVSQSGQQLRPIVAKLHDLGIRVSLFMDPDIEEISLVPETGAERIELYTEAYAQAYGTPRQDEVFDQYVRAAAHAQSLGLGVNAGHDLNLDNLGLFRTIGGILEVSIGQALICDALEMGLSAAVEAYVGITDQ